MYGISRDGSKNFNIRTCEHMIIGQLRIGARTTTYAALQRAALFVSGRLLGAVNNIAEFSDSYFGYKQTRSRKLFKYCRSLGILGGCQAIMQAEARSTRKER